MPVSIYWLLPERVVYVRIMGVVSIAEMAQTQVFNREILDNTTHEHPVQFIFDSSTMEKGPTNPKDVREANAPFLASPKLGWGVLIETRPIIRFVTTISAQVSRVPLKSVASYAAALDFLRYIDQTLPPLPSEPPLNDVPLTVIEIPASN